MKPERKAMFFIIVVGFSSGPGQVGSCVSW